MKEHWETVYQMKGRDEVSWFREHLDTSLKMISNTGVGKDASIIDVGGGNSTLVDDLLDSGFVDISVLDISANAIDGSKKRLGTKAKGVDWIVADITTAELPVEKFDVWHDRAVFHFLTDENDRRKYVELVIRSLKPEGHIILASFSLEGPKKCSGLDVMRYSPETMHSEFGRPFQLVASQSETHNTPFGTTQEFVYCYCRKSFS
ncbi:MAG: class I SAM-dependent methyltransferase [Acidobacteria bacterium]|nr:class I SAM-dependent methyltransferase [Acidobacteriota bacterium]